MSKLRRQHMTGENDRKRLILAVRAALILIAAMTGIIAKVGTVAAQAKAPCKEMRKIKIGVSVAPPNVVHTPVYVARDLGIFKSRCIDAEIVEFEGGSSAANLAAVTQGQAVASINATAISQGLKAKQIWGVALHPEDVHLAQKEKPGLHVLVDLSKLMPKYFFNAYGAADSMLAKDRAMVRDVATSLIEANRVIYNQKEKVIPIMVEATKKPQEAVSFSYDYLVKNCVWSVNTGFSRERTEWSIDNGIENGDIQADKKPTYDQVVDVKLGEEALKAAGGPTKIRGCGD